MSNLPLPGHGKFHDLNLPYDNVKNVTKRLAMLVELGYEVVALTTTLMSGQTTSKKQKKPLIPKPPDKIDISEEITSNLKRDNKTLMQLTRLTIELKEIEDLTKVRDAVNGDMYDVIAVLPRTERLFQASCTELNVDIISIDGCEKLPYIPRSNVVKAACSRGIFFEVCYSPMIRDATVRRITISNIQRLVEFSKGKNIILTSNSLTPLELRGPYDVANLNSLFGIHENVFVHTVSKNCRAAVVHGFSRKTAKNAIYLQKLPIDVKRDISNENCNPTDIEDEKDSSKIVTENSDVDADLNGNNLINTDQVKASKKRNNSTPLVACGNPSKKKNLKSSKKRRISVEDASSSPLKHNKLN